jgi:hypothetical protein
MNTEVSRRAALAMPYIRERGRDFEGILSLRARFCSALCLRRSVYCVSSSTIDIVHNG